MRFSTRTVVLPVLVICSVVFIGQRAGAVAQQDGAAITDQIGNYRDQVVDWASRPSYTDRYMTSTNSGSLAWGESYILRGILEAYKITGDTTFLRKVSMHADSLFSVARDTPEEAEFDTMVYQDGLLGWGSTGYSDEYDEYIVHDGHVCAPLAEYIALVFADSTLWDDFGAKAQEHFVFLETNVAGKWLPYLNGDMGYSASGTYGITMREWGGLSLIPHNQYAAFGLFLLMMNDVTNTARYQDLFPDNLHAEYRQWAVEMGEFFQRYVKETESGEYKWTYSLSSNDEDISHANLELEFVAALYERGLVFDAADMIGFGRTITRALWNGSLDQPRFAHNVSGQGDYDWNHYLWGWSLFGRYYPLAWYVMDQYFQERVYENGETIRTSYALVAMARLHRAREQFLSGGLILPVGSIVADEDGDQLVRPEEQAAINVELTNYGFADDSTWVKLSSIEPLVAAVGAESLLVHVKAGSTVVAELPVYAPSGISAAVLSAFLEAGYYRKGASITTGSPSIMFVEGVPPDTSGHADEFYTKLYLSEPFHRFRQNDAGLTTAALQKFNTVIWRCSRAVPSSEDVAALAEYLDGGGHLIMCGGRAFPQIIHRSEADSLFMADYLQVTDAYDVTDSLMGLAATVEAQNTNQFGGIGAGRHYLRTGNTDLDATVPCDVITTTAPADQCIILSAQDKTTEEVPDLPSTIAGVGIDSTYHAIVLGWDLDDMASVGYSPMMVVMNALVWLESPTGIRSDEMQRPEEMQVSAFPNPFNPVTTIQMNGLVPGQPVTMQIVNTLGQRVCTRTFSAPGTSHTIQWQAVDSQGRMLGSGTYLVAVDQCGIRRILRVQLAR